MAKKLSQSKISGQFCNQLEALPERIQDRLNKAAELANKNIERNNIIYESSRANAKNYPVN